MPGEESSFAQVIIPSPLKEPLTYEIPRPLRDILQIGARVLVPLGKRKIAGVVAGFASETDLKQIKPIVEAMDERPVMDGSLLKLVQWIAQYYLATIGEALATVLPAALRAESRRTIIARQGEFAVTGALQQKILQEIRRRKGPVAVKSLARKFLGGGFYRTLEELAAVGAVEVREGSLPKKRKKNLAVPPLQPEPAQGSTTLSLNVEQQRALGAIEARLQGGGFETFLLYGVTGSGKTEIYLRAIEAARQTKRQSLVLVPEISLTPQLLDRLHGRFADRVGVLHSALTASERWAQWWRILRGEVDVVIGARSALFAPLPDLGLIVVDEEHDPSYKQDEGLRYNARDVAVVRGKMLGCPVVLGSATPAIESFENCRGGRYRLLELTQRVEERAMPQVEIVDLRDREPQTADNEQSNGQRPAVSGLISLQLTEALQQNLARRRQSLIFLNRRGFANFLQCRLCGFVLRCDHCSVSMTFHQRLQSVLCHHCALRKPARDLCPGCNHATLGPVGFGTEQLEQELGRLLPQARIERMDRDTTGRRGSQERLIRQWEKGEIDILVGTQMITKGHDVSGVTLVGAILADLSLNLPDFRAAERTFQLLSQVAGRAGRGDEPGRVIIQTYSPDHYVLRDVITHDYKSFFASEIEFRRALNYPPFSRLVHLRLEGAKAPEVEERAKILGDRLRARCQGGMSALKDIEVLGPAPAPISKLRGRYRWQILLKGKRGQALLQLASDARAALPASRHTRLHIDVDPYNML